jgi:hypothetical protein
LGVFLAVGFISVCQSGLWESEKDKCTIGSRDVLLRGSTRGHPFPQSRNIILFSVGLKFKTKKKKEKKKKKGLGLKQK